MDGKQRFLPKEVIPWQGRTLKPPIFRFGVQSAGHYVLKSGVHLYYNLTQEWMNIIAFGEGRGALKYSSIKKKGGGGGPKNVFIRGGGGGGGR